MQNHAFSSGLFSPLEGALFSDQVTPDDLVLFFQERSLVVEITWAKVGVYTLKLGYDGVGLATLSADNHAELQRGLTVDQLLVEMTEAFSCEVLLGSYHRVSDSYVAQVADASLTQAGSAAPLASVTEAKPPQSKGSSTSKQELTEDEANLVRVAQIAEVSPSSLPLLASLYQVPLVKVELESHKSLLLYTLPQDKVSLLLGDYPAIVLSSCKNVSRDKVTDELELKVKLLLDEDPEHYHSFDFSLERLVISGELGMISPPSPTTKLVDSSQTLGVIHDSLPGVDRSRAILSASLDQFQALANFCSALALPKQAAQFLSYELELDQVTAGELISPNSFSSAVKQSVGTLLTAPTSELELLAKIVRFVLDHPKLVSSVLLAKQLLGITMVIVGLKLGKNSLLYKRISGRASIGIGISLIGGSLLNLLLVEYVKHLNQKHEAESLDLNL